MKKPVQPKRRDISTEPLPIEKEKEPEIQKDAVERNPKPTKANTQVVERQHRSQIFDKILSEDREAQGGGGDGPKKSKQRKEEPKEPNKPKAKGEKPQQPRPKGLSATAEYSQKKAAAERYRASGDHRAAAVNYQRALELAPKANVDSTQQTRLHIEHADVLGKLNRLDEAKAALERAEALLPSVTGAASHELRVSIDLQLGGQALYSGEFSEAERRHINAINRYEEHCSPNDSRLGRMYLDLGRVYFDALYLDNAIEITLNALNVFEHSKHDVREDMVALYRQLAAIAHRKGELEATVKHLLEAYRLATDSPNANRRVLTEIEITLGTIYSHVGEYETASSWYAAAIEHQEQSRPRSKWPLSLLYANYALVQARGAGEPESHSFDQSLTLQFTEMVMGRNS
ncbi:MAG: tetratricopeptide repeat protein [Verrucomicrobiota bacterium]